MQVLNEPILIGKALKNPKFSIEEIQNATKNSIPLGTTSDNQWCAFMRNGISIGADGAVLVCAYSLESSGMLGNIRGKSLKEFVGKANQLVDEFFRKEGHSRCILRHEKYNELAVSFKNCKP